MRIALASSNGDIVDLHLGKAVSLVIYDVFDNDCDVIISTKYGFKSKIKAEDAGIKLVSDEGPVEEVLQRYIDHYNFMNS